MKLNQGVTTEMTDFVRHLYVSRRGGIPIVTACIVFPSVSCLTSIIDSQKFIRS